MIIAVSLGNIRHSFGYKVDKIEKKNFPCDEKSLDLPS